ncbi:MAG: carbon storage regulator [Desulfurellales bacterium]|nr:MAG: carbon storage regulator [Desulfurellales bacterium]
MLAFSRKPGECFYVDGPAMIRIHTVRGTSVKIGVQADPSVRITRGELLERSAINAACQSSKPVNPDALEMTR